MYVRWVFELALEYLSPNCIYCRPPHSALFKPVFTRINAPFIQHFIVPAVESFLT